MTVVGLMLDARSDKNALVVDALLHTILPKKLSDVHICEEINLPDQ
jgi:hypothetical protein